MTGWPGYEALAPFFRIINEGLSGLVDGEHFFDTIAEDAVFEYVISVPGYPRRIVGRDAVAELYSGYGETMVLHGSDELAVHPDREASVVVLEYAVHGRAVRTWTEVRRFGDREMHIGIRVTGYERNTPLRSLAMAEV